MTSDLRIQGEVVVNSEKAESAFDRVGDKAQQMANEVATSAGKAGQAVDKIGDGAGASAEKFTRAESRMSAAIKKATNELELLGKTASQRLEFNIADKGLDASKFEPALKKLREVEAQAQAAQRAATGSLDKMGISAAQTAAALRGVPAQFTDIVTSLQGGQAPLTVFLQQGGQLRDMFGGAGAAARALGGYVLGLVNPFTIAAATVAGIAVAYNQGRKEAEAFNKTLILSGNAAGTSADSLSDMARAIDATSNGITQSKAAEVLNSIAASGDVAADKLQRYAQVAIEFGRAGGGAADEVAKALSSLAGDPLTAVEKLNKSTNFLTAEIYNQIKALEDEGRSTDAARVAQDAYASMLDQRIPKLKDNLGLLERGWMGVKDAAAEAWDSMLNVGRAQTIGGRLEAAQKLLADYESTLPGKRTTEQVARVAEAGGVNGLRSQIAGLQELMETQRKADEQQRANNQSTQAAINLSKQASQFDTDLEKQRKAVAQATELYNTALAAGNLSESARAQLEKDYLKTVTGITAAKEQRATSTRKENKDLADQSRIFAELAGVSSTYYTELAAAQAQRAKGNISEAQYIAYVEELIQKQPFAVELAKEETEANKALSKSYAEAAAERLKTIQSMERAADGLQSQNDALRDEIELIGLSTEQQTLVLQQRNDVIILTKEATLAELERQSAITGTQTRVEIALAAEIAALKERNALLGAKGVKNAAVDAAKQAEGEWKKTTDQINQSLTDALMRGFESGKGFAQNLRDTVVNMFQTMVLRPTISAILAPVAGGVTGLLGLSGAANAGQGAGSLMGMASNASSAYNLLTGGAAIASSLGGAAISLGNLIGSSAVTSFGAGMAGATLAPGLMGPTTIGATGAMGAGASLGSTLAAIPGWGWALAGIGALFGGDIINGLFGRKLKDSGIEGDFGGASGFEGRQFEYYKGGLFRSNKTKYKDLDEETRAALADTFNAMRSGAKEMAGVLGLGTQAIDGFTAHVKVSLKGLSAEEADKRLKEEFDKVAESLASTTLGTQDYTRAGETAVQTLTRLSGSLTGVNQVFENLGATLYASSLAGADMASQLVDLFGGMDGLSQTAGSYMQNYYSADEQRAAVQRQLQTAFDGLELKLPDIDASDARAQFRALAEAQDLTTDAGRKTYASLLQLSGAFAGITQSADEAAQAAQRLADQQQRQADDAVNQALAQLRQVVKRERDALSAQADTLKSVIGQIGGAVGLLTSNARELYGSVDSTRQMLAAQGMVYIEDALAGVRAGASVVDYGGLADAIGAARSGVNAGVYASEFERQRDTLVLAGQLAELGQISDAQLSVEERALKAVQEQIAQLDKTLDYWEQQASGMGDLLNASLSIEGAIGSLAAALAQREAAKQPAGGGGGGRPGVDFNQGLQQQIAEAWNAGDWITAQNIIRGYGFSNDQLKEAFDLNYADLRYLYSHGYTGQNPGDYSFSAKTAEGVYAEAKAQGLTLKEVDALIQAPSGTAEEWAKANGLPIFHQGTNYVPRTGFALLEQGEQVVPRVYNPFAGGQMPQGNNAELIAEVRALRAEVAALRAPMEQTAQATTQQAAQFDNVTAGGNAMATEAMA